MNSDEYAKLQKELTIQFEEALAGERPVFCRVCGRPFRARETTKFGDVFRSVRPFRHSREGTARDRCPGSDQHAWLNLPK